MQNSNAICRMSFTSPFIIHVSQNESATISFKAKKKKKNYIPFSPVSSWLLPISFVPIIFICTSPSPSLVIHIGRSFSSKRPLWITTPTPFFAETYWLFWWSRATLQKYSPSFLFKWERPWRGPVCGSMHKSQQSLPSCTCVKHCVVGRLHCAKKPSVFLFFRSAEAAW